ncbi:hypothetical protein NDI52_23730 [Leptolyngbya sp. PL-A3]|nr:MULTISPECIES: solute carrier family 23 protein [unclassified Leptolyngbya]MBD1912570.1 hypothetical protein [Leptolyngbya sp. FACHB-8]MBD2158480.1 hypothetical protein [Leptolyngbya sp. FACHB-16]
MVQREESNILHSLELPEAEGFPELSATSSELIYKLHDRPPLLESIFVAIQHVLAAFVGIVTPPLIISTSLGLDPTNTSFIVSMSLLASGICTFIQCKTFGPVGSGLLSLQGTSFAFLGAILGVAGTAIDAGRTPQQALALIFGVQPAIIKNMFGSATSTGGLTAILLSWLLPQAPQAANSMPPVDSESL